MGRIESFPDEMAGSKCSICGEDAVAYWHGDTPIFICQDCALDALPKLFADAVHVPPPSTRGATVVSSATGALRQFTSTFWYAMTCRMDIERRRKLQQESS